MPTLVIRPVRAGISQAPRNSGSATLLFPTSAEGPHKHPTDPLSFRGGHWPTWKPRPIRPDFAIQPTSRFPDRSGGIRGGGVMPVIATSASDLLAMTERGGDVQSPSPFDRLRMAGSGLRAQGRQAQDVLRLGRGVAPAGTRRGRRSGRDREMVWSASTFDAYWLVINPRNRGRNLGPLLRVTERVGRAKKMLRIQTVRDNMHNRSLEQGITCVEHTRTAKNNGRKW